MREACFLKTHMFLEIAQETGGHGGGNTRERVSERIGSGCRDTLKDNADNTGG